MMNPVKREIVVLIALVAGGIIFVTGNRGSWPALASFSTPLINIPGADSAGAADSVWRVFEDYLAFAGAHNLEGLKGLSHQLSPACSDRSREQECFALMDSVYSIAGALKQSDFKHIEADARQIVLWTEGPDVAILYFTRNVGGEPRVLGLQFCLELKADDGCVEPELLKLDENENGWWDKVEALFYKN